MPRIVPRDELLRKTAALRGAELLGRSMAQEQANEELAKIAGLILSGELTPEEWEMLKEAGIFSAIGGRIAKSGFGQAVGRGASNVFSASNPVGYGLRRAGQAIKGAGGKAYSWGKAAVKPVQQAATAAGKSGVGQVVKGVGKQVAGVGKSLGTFAKVAPWVAGAGVTYGLMKGVPWAARQLEHSSATPMAPAMGWSATPYGYGSSPYGGGMQSMGPGA